MSSSTWRRRAERLRNPAGGLDLDGMPLAVANGQGMKLEAGRASLGQRRGRVEAAAQKDDGTWLGRHGLSRCLEVIGRLIRAYPSLSVALSTR